MKLYLDYQVLSGTISCLRTKWNHDFADGATFKHNNMDQGIYVDPVHDFCGM